MRRFFASPENISENRIELNVEESKHLRDVLRLHVGSIVAVFDGAGREFVCTIEKIGRRDENARLRINEQVAPPAPESALNFTLAVALLKGERFDLVVQKATELGVTTIAPLETIRADVKLKDERDALKRVERWRRIALEAAKQCGRAVIPTITKPENFENFVRQTNENCLRIFFAERSGTNLHQIFLRGKIEKVTAVVGSEGGWDVGEIEAARANQFEIITLGGRILRAETAAITAAVLLQHHGGDLR
jgi:16S rRNA (uracil1498-N3)-methyltransferase